MPKVWRLNRTAKYKKLSVEEREVIRAKATQCREENCWTPNQLRHVAATLIRKEYGIEVASIILGHSSLNTTEVYAEADLEKAARAMADFG
jgi:site-specific recombinase XerD